MAEVAAEFRLNRVFSRPLTRLLLKTPLTPNQTTLLSLFFGILAGCLFSNGAWRWGILGALSYQLAVLLDNCDGEIARAKNWGSSFGAWLDIACDLLVDLSLFLGIAIGMANKAASGPIRLFAFLCVSGAMFHFALVVTEKLKGFGPAAFGAPHPEHKTRKNFFLSVFDALREGEISWLVLLFALMNKTGSLLWLGGIYMQIIWISALLINFKWLFLRTRHEPRPS